MQITLQSSLFFLALAGCGKELPPPPDGAASPAGDDTADVATGDDTGPQETTTDDDPETPGGTTEETGGVDDTGGSSPDDTGGASPDDTAVTDSGATTGEDGECVPAGGDWPISSGSYTGSVDAAVFNNCENDIGHGYHIHVGASNPVGMTADDNCLVADFGGMYLEGEVDADGAVSLVGYLDDAQTSYCTVRIHGTLVGESTGEDAFDYVMEAVAEPLDEDCELLVGDGETHTFPSLPCDFSWRGRVWKN